MLCAVLYSNHNRMGRHKPHLALKQVRRKPCVYESTCLLDENEIAVPLNILLLWETQSITCDFIDHQSTVACGISFFFFS